MTINAKLVQQIETTFAQKPTSELEALLTDHNTAEWSDEAFAAATEIVEKRRIGIAAEPQITEQEPELVPTEQAALPEKSLWRRLVPILVTLALIGIGLRIVSYYMERRIWNTLQRIEQREGKPILDVLEEQKRKSNNR